LSSKKKFAYPTKEEALEGFKASKKRQISILRSKLEQAETALGMVEQPGFVEEAIN
jgi:hypothetical protein